jgi:hypothetical protein
MLMGRRVRGQAAPADYVAAVNISRRAVVIQPNAGFAI